MAKTGNRAQNNRSNQTNPDNVVYAPSQPDSTNGSDKVNTK